MAGFILDVKRSSYTEGLTNSMSTGTSRTHNQGMTVLIECEHSLRLCRLLTILSYTSKTRNPAGEVCALHSSSRSWSRWCTGRQKKKRPLSSSRYHRQQVASPYTAS